MAVVIPPESDLGKELARWDAPRREGGMRPDGHEDYPKMVYMAHRYSNGKVMCGHPGASTGDDAEAIAFNAKCMAIAHSPDEHDNMRRHGWCDSPQAALAAFEAQEQAIARAAAEEQYRVKRMSEKAQGEFDAAQDAADFHDPDPAAPKKAPKGTRVLTESDLKKKKE